VTGGELPSYDSVLIITRGEARVEVFKSSDNSWTVLYLGEFGDSIPMSNMEGYETD
jgi:hypothetical protein